MSDEFPQMPTRYCPDCGKEKKAMFFAPKGTYCREHALERNRAARAAFRATVDPGYEFNRQPIDERRRG